MGILPCDKLSLASTILLRLTNCFHTISVEGLVLPELRCFVFVVSEAFTGLHSKADISL